MLRLSFVFTVVLLISHYDIPLSTATGYSHPSGSPLQPRVSTRHEVNERQNPGRMQERGGGVCLVTRLNS